MRERAGTTVLGPEPCKPQILLHLGGNPESPQAPWDSVLGPVPQSLYLCNRWSLFYSKFLLDTRPNTAHRRERRMTQHSGRSRPRRGRCTPGSLDGREGTGWCPRRSAGDRTDGTDPRVGRIRACTLAVGQTAVISRETGERNSLPPQWWPIHHHLDSFDLSVYLPHVHPARARHPQPKHSAFGLAPTRGGPWRWCRVSILK